MFRKFFRPNSFFICFFGIDRLLLYRKWWGGHWERWHVDFPVCNYVWISVESCSVITNNRPGLCRGTPICEEHFF